jgi:hypothetical protein
LIRIVEPIEGTPRISVVCEPRLGWSKERPPVLQGSHHLEFEGFASQLRLTTNIPLPYLGGQPFTLTDEYYRMTDTGLQGTYYSRDKVHVLFSVDTAKSPDFNSGRAPFLRRDDDYARLDLRDEQLEIIEVEVTNGAPAAGKPVSDMELPDGALIISVLREDGGFVPKADTMIEAGDEVLLVLDPGLEDAIMEQFAPNGGRPD